MNLIEQYENLIAATSIQKPVVPVIQGFKNTLISLNEEALLMFGFKTIDDFYNNYLSPASLLAFGDFEQNENVPEINKEERHKIYDTESYEREMILNDLKFSTHISMSKFNEPITSRRFLATNDSCLSFVQVSYIESEDTYRWVFVSRSTEINRMLPADLYTIGLIISDWTMWFRSYVSNPPPNEAAIHLTILLNNPHYYK